jgi:hypothetical protein
MMVARKGATVEVRVNVDSWISPPADLWTRVEATLRLVELASLVKSEEDINPLAAPDAKACIVGSV